MDDLSVLSLRGGGFGDLFFGDLFPSGRRGGTEDKDQMNVQNHSFLSLCSSSCDEKEDCDFSDHR